MSSLRHTSPSTAVVDLHLPLSTATNGASILDKAGTKQSGLMTPVLASGEDFSRNDSSINNNTHAVEAISVSSSPDYLSAILHVIDEATRDVHLRPYHLLHRLFRSCWYNLLGYPDLAAGDAYKTLLLLDEACDEASEHYEEVVEELEIWLRDYRASGHQDGKTKLGALAAVIRMIDELENIEGAKASFDSIQKDHVERPQEELLQWLVETCYVAAYRILGRALWICGCWKSAVDFLERGRRQFPEHPRLRILEENMLKWIEGDMARKGQPFNLNNIKAKMKQLPDQGQVRRQIYPWTISRKGRPKEPHQFRQDPDRLSESALTRINVEMKRVAPKLEIKVVELSVLHPDPAIIEAQKVKQLGVFAKEDIEPNEKILEEYTLYTANSRSYEAFCDACCVALSDSNSHAASTVSADSAVNVVSCPECDVLFCSPTCFNLAAENYHTAICGRDLEDLCKDVPPTEAADAMYTLLLLRSLAMAETQDVHPLDLKLMEFVCGDFNEPPKSWQPFPHSYDATTRNEGSDSVRTTANDLFQNAPHTLPFSFQANILTPLHILEKMDVNIFTEEYKYDIWVFNMLYSKFRATASARMGRDGSPEVAAVHPLWCLANHSCAPNVEWEWGGSITFRARETRIRWSARKGRADGEDEEEVILRQERGGGIKKGEEVLNHYCDVELPVKERREWAVGALGGMCMCERCVAEAACGNGE